VNSKAYHLDELIQAGGYSFAMFSSPNWI